MLQVCVPQNIALRNGDFPSSIDTCVAVSSCEIRLGGLPACTTLYRQKRREEATVEEMAKYTLIAYLLWLLGGWFGLHHFYLGRDKQGILWLTSFSGLFVIGWLRDFWRIPTYVKDANEDKDYMRFLIEQMRYYKRPPIYQNLHRIVGQVLFGYFYRMLVKVAVPEEYYVSSPLLLLLVVPLGTAFGTYMVSNVGRMRSAFVYSLFGAYMGEVLFGELHLLFVEECTPSFAVGTSMLFSTYDWKYQKNYEAKKFCKRLALCTMFFFLFCGLCASYIYFNASIETEDGETVKVREAVNNFLNSPAWQEMKHSLWEVWREFQREGWEGAKKTLFALADVEGEEHALIVLGLKKGATLKEIKERYRQLAKQWHPDHHQGEENKAHAQKKIIMINQAHEVLTKIYGRKKKATH